MESVLFKFSVGNFSKHLTIFVCQHEWISSVNRSRNPLQNEAWYYYGIPTQCDCFIPLSVTFWVCQNGYLHRRLPSSYTLPRYCNFQCKHLHTSNPSWAGNYMYMYKIHNYVHHPIGNNCGLQQAFLRNTLTNYTKSEYKERCTLSSFLSNRVIDYNTRLYTHSVQVWICPCINKVK